MLHHVFSQAQRNVGKLYLYRAGGGTTWCLVTGLEKKANAMAVVDLEMLVLLLFKPLPRLGTRDLSNDIPF